MKFNHTYNKIYKIVARIPYGKVATYGQIARLAGFAGHARLVGYALHSLPQGINIPWHRVVNRLGKISLQDSQNNDYCLQQKLLEQEGLIFNRSGKLDLEIYGWNE